MAAGSSASEHLNAARKAASAGDVRALEDAARALIDIATAERDARHLAFGHYYLASSYWLRDDGVRTETECRKALELFTEAGDREGIARATIGLAAKALELDMDMVEARRLLDEALPISRELGDANLIVQALANLAEVCRFDGDYDGAIAKAREAAELYERLGHLGLAAVGHANIAHVHALRRDYAGAASAMRDGWERLAHADAPLDHAKFLDICVVLAAMTERWDDAARLYGFIGEYRHEHHVRRQRGLLPWLSKPIEEMPQRVGEHRFHELVAEGERLSLAYAEALARSIFGVTDS